MKRVKLIFFLAIAFVAFALAGCETTPPEEQENTTQLVAEYQNLAVQTATATTAWYLQFEKPATANETLRVLGTHDEMVQEIMFQLPYGGEMGGGIVKHGNIQATIQQAAGNFQKMSVRLVYPTNEQLTENAKDSTTAALSIASIQQIRTTDEANLLYVKTNGIPVSGVRFMVTPWQEQSFVAHWSKFVDTNQTRFKVTQAFTGRTISPISNRSTR